MADTLLTRLRAIGGSSTSDGGTRYYVNPDGPEAADEIERLEDSVSGLENEIQEARRPRGYDSLIRRANAAQARAEKLAGLLRRIVDYHVDPDEAIGACITLQAIADEAFDDEAALKENPDG